MFYSAAHDTSRVRSAKHIAAGVRTRRRHRFDFVSRACGTVFAVGVAPCWSSRVRVQIQRRKCWRIRGPLTRTDYNWMHRHIVVRYGYSCPVRAVHGHSHRAGCEARSRRVLAPSPHSNNTSARIIPTTATTMAIEHAAAPKSNMATREESAVTRFIPSPKKLAVSRGDFLLLYLCEIDECVVV